MESKTTLIDTASNFLKFAKVVEKTIDDHRPIAPPEAVLSFSRAVATGSHEIINFALTECQRAGVCFKDLEWYCRKINVDCWLIATQIPEGKTENDFCTFTKSKESLKYQIMISCHDGYTVFKSFYENEPKKYIENFKRLNESGYICVKKGENFPFNGLYKAMVASSQ